MVVQCLCGMRIVRCILKITPGIILSVLFCVIKGVGGGSRGFMVIQRDVKDTTRGRFYTD